MASTWREMTAAQATVLVALIAIIPAAISGAVSSMVSYQKVVSEISENLTQ